MRLFLARERSNVGPPLDIAAAMAKVSAEADQALAGSERLLEEAKAASVLRRAKVPVAIQAKSSNRKLAPQRVVDVNGRDRCEPIGPYVTSTYVAIEPTCPASCPYRGNGCYAQAGMAVRPLDREARRGGWTGSATIAAEVEAIDRTLVRGVPQDGANGGRDLRLHVSGDAHDTAGAEALAGAAERWRARGGASVWTFTHLWREIPRGAWGPISVLASVETEADAIRARRRGYAPALTTQKHESDGSFVVGRDTRIVPCPAQTRGRTCAECRLCLDVTPSRGVSFELHGREEKRARKRLSVIQGEA